MNTCWCAVFTIILVSAIVSGQTSCTRVTDPSVLEGNANMIIVDHVFYSEINSQRICGIRCMQQRKCRSINYNLTSSLCELNNASYNSAPADLQSAEGVVHFAAEEWPQALLGACQNHVCPPDKVCVSNTAVTGARYQCEIPWYQITKTLIVCQDILATIQCYTGERITVTYANYGRTADGSVCPHSSIKTTECRASSSLTKVMEWCEGKTACDVIGDHTVFGDPCGGTYKYLEVHYKCV